MVTHVLFDFDGTLVNTIEAFQDLVTDIFQQNGTKVTDEILDYLPNIESLRSAVDLFNNKFNLDIDYTIFSKKALLHIVNAKLRFMPGVERLVKHLHANHIPMAVATGNVGFYYQNVIKKFDDFFPKHFDHAVCAWDDPEVVNKKPNPDCYWVAMKRFKQPPTEMKNVLIFEDSITGLKGAVASGGKTVLVNKLSSTLNDKYSDIIEKADIILDSMDHFKPELFGLPAFD